jgi:N-acetylneuraminate synthase
MQYDVPFIKIPSALMTNLDLVKAIAQTGKPIVMSTGMSTVSEIDSAVETLCFYASRDNFAMMHTNSTYPTPNKDLNLRTIKFLKERYGCTIGYSGHEFGLEPSVIAVALGARIIERHVTLDHNMWGTDQAASLEVHAMDLLRKRITEADICLGDGVKRVTEDEMKKREKLRGDK